MNEHREISALPLTEQMIGDYLRAHPEFFDAHPELLLQLRLPHVERGTVSLIEHQQRRLRERIEQLEQERQILLNNAQHNEQTHHFFSRLLFSLLSINDNSAMLETVQKQLLEGFGFSRVNVYIRQEQWDFNPVSLAEILTKRLDPRGYYLGRLPAYEARELVQLETGSVALIGLGKAPDWFGVLAIASQDPRHFSPEMGTLLLDDLQRLLNHRLGSTCDGD